MDQNAYQLLYAIGHFNQQRDTEPDETPIPTRLFQTWLSLKFKSWKIEIQRAIEPEQEPADLGFTRADHTGPSPVIRG